ncbi:MAG: hypothetical protein ACLQFI_01690 [Methylocella sp.]
MPFSVFSMVAAANTFKSETEVAARTQLANARFHRLLDYCADALGESIRATEELSQRMSYLRKEIEAHSCNGQALDPLVHTGYEDQVEPTA